MKSIVYLSIFIVLSVVGCALLGMSISPPMEILYYLGYFISFEFVLYLMVNYRISGKNVTYSSVFISVLFLFHFGQLVLYSFFQGVYSHIRFLYLLTPENASQGFLLMVYSFTAICIGSLIRESGIAVNCSPKDAYYNSHCDWEKVARIIIYWTFWVKVVLDVITLVISITNGGESARLFVNRFPNVFLYYGKISLVGFALLIFAQKDTPQKQRKTFLFIEVYILFMMISGIRSENVAYLLVFFFVFIASRNNHSIKKIIVGSLIAAFVVLPFIVAIGQFRSASNRSIETLSKVYRETEENDNTLLGLLDNMGDTGYTAQAVINWWLPKFGPTYGESYYTGVVAIIPNIPGILDMGSITESGAFAIKLQKNGVLNNNYYNIGGSLLGELFMNWGVLGGVIASLIFGFFIGWVSQGIRYCFNNNNYYRALLFIPIMLASLYWVRSYFGGCIREAVWGILFAYLIARTSVKKNSNKMDLPRHNTVSTN